MTALTESNFAQFVQQFDHFLFDCDGVLWDGSKPIADSVEFVRKLHALKKTTVFVTNNSTKSRAAYVDKFAGFGLNVSEAEIFTGGYAAAFYLQERKFTGKVYCAGEPGLAAELRAAGVQLCDDVHTDRMPADHDDSFSADTLPSDDVRAVVVGFNCRFNYRVLAFAHHVLHRRPANLFVATNADPQYPVAGRLWPGTGALVAALACSAEREPIVLGKPHTLLVDLIDKKFCLDRARTVMIGDRLSTDITFGRDAGLKTCLVFSGVETKDTLARSEIKPDFVVDRIGQLPLRGASHASTKGVALAISCVKRRDIKQATSK